MSTPTIINSPEAKRRIKGAFQDISDVMVKIEAGRDTIKQIVADFAEEFQIEKKVFAKMAKTFHKQSFQAEVAEKTEFEIIYETVTGESSGEAEFDHNSDPDADADE
jgi:S-adenosylmethionine synthetase